MRLYETKRSWSVASAFCVAEKGQLARNINTKRNDWISGQSSQEIWFGASDSATEGEWKDMDGNAQEFTKWNQGEPSNHNTILDQDCAYTNYKRKGLWDDTACDTPKFFVCEKGKKSYTYIG